MNELEENDGELALFLEEMRQEAPRLQAILSKNRLPRYAEIDLQSVRALVKDRNLMVTLLREFVALHPEDTDLVRRARRYTR